MPKIAIIDDDELFIDSWKLILKEYEVDDFDSPDDFKSRAGDLSQYELIITDYYFGLVLRLRNLLSSKRLDCL